MRPDGGRVSAVSRGSTRGQEEDGPPRSWLKKNTEEDEEGETSSGSLIRTGRRVSQQKKRQASLFGRKSLIDLLPFQKHEVCHL